jgi:YVTN family beta-propeller protein
MHLLSWNICAFLALLWMPVCLWSETTAYFPNPNSGADNIKRVFVSNEDDFDSTDLSGDNNGAYGVAVTLDGEELVVTRTEDDTVTLIPTDLFANSDVQNDVYLDDGDAPRGVAIESRGIYAYVAKYGDDSVDQIAINSGAVVDTFDVGRGPWGVAATYDSAEETVKVYVSNHDDDSVSIIDDNGVDTIPNVGGGPIGVALTPDGSYLYVANYDDDTVAVIDTRDRTIDATIDVGNGPWGVAMGDDGAYVFVTNSLADTVSVIATERQSVSDTYSVGEQPMGVAAPVNGDFAYVVNHADDTISKVTTGGSVTTIGSGELVDAYALGTFLGGSPPDAPSGLEAAMESSNEIFLSWTDNADDELGFKIERREDSQEAYVQIAKVDADEIDYTDTGLARATTYHYRVRAFNEASDSDYGSSASATTGNEQASWCFINSLMEK